MPSISSLVPRLARISRASYGSVAGLGAASLWGWVLGVPRLRDLGADFAPMSPGAALAFLLLATSFSAAQTGRRRSAVTAALLAGLIAALTLAETLFALPFGMSFEWLAARGSELPGRMSLAACVTMMLLAMVTPLARDRNIFSLPANGLAAIVIGSVAFFALLGLSLRVLRFDIAAPLLGFSAPAALATMLAAIALAAGRPSGWLLDTLSSKRTGAVVTRWLLPAAMVVPIAVGWMRLYAEREGLFGEAFGMALFTLVMIAWFSSFILWVARDGAVHPVSVNAAPILDGEGLLGAVL